MKKLDYFYAQKFMLQTASRFKTEAARLGRVIDGLLAPGDREHLPLSDEFANFCRLMWLRALRDIERSGLQAGTVFPEKHPLDTQDFFLVEKLERELAAMKMFFQEACKGLGIAGS